MNLAEKILVSKKQHYVYSWFANAELFSEIIEALIANYKNLGITKVVGPESRGFILGSVLAYELGAGFVVARKGGKMFEQPYKGVFTREYIDYSENTKSLEIEDSEIIISKDDKALIVDDWVETCNSMKVIVDILENDVQCKIIGIATILDDSNGKFEQLFSKYKLTKLSRT